MMGALNTLGRLGGPRGLLAMSLLLGSLSTVAGRGTLAFFTSNITSQANTFSGGIVDINGDFTGSTKSLLTRTAFGWTANGANDNGGAGDTSGLTPVSGTDCRHILTGLDIRTQAMTPGQYCVARVDINNDNTTSVDAWMRMRVVRTTPTNWSATADIVTGTEALNDRLKFYMHEYTAGTTAAAKTARDADCAVTTYKPTYTGPSSTGTAGDTARFTSVPGTSAGKILNASGTLVGSASRTALTSLGETGKNLGAHPGISAVTVTGVAGARGTYGADQDQEVLDLVNKSDEQTTDATTGAAGDNKTSRNGLRLKAGTSPDATLSQGAAPSEANMSTALSTRNSFNLLGNDEITNPIKMGVVTGTNNSFNPTTSSTSSVTGRNGTEPHGSNLESELKKGQSRYYCAAIFFPMDTDLALSTVYASKDTVGSQAGLGEAYPSGYGTGATSQYKDCSAENVVTAVGYSVTGCATLGAADAALTAANRRGDNAAQLGQATYYLVVSAAQKAGRTVN